MRRWASAALSRSRLVALPSCRQARARARGLRPSRAAARWLAVHARKCCGSRRRSSTTPNAHPCSISRAPPSRPGAARAGARPSNASGPRSSGQSTRSPAPPHAWATTASTSSPPTRSDARRSPSSTPPNPAGQLRPLRLPRPTRASLLPRLGPRRPRHRRDPALGPPAATRTTETSDIVGELATQSEAFRTDRGRAQRPLPQHRRQAPQTPVVASSASALTGPTSPQTTA
jgi:hypothetical protein